MHRTCLLLLLVAACGGGVPTPTGTVCPDPDPLDLTYDNFGMQFMATYCTMCHASTLPHSQRNGAPLYHDFDSLEGIMRVPDHIDEQAGAGPDATNTFMPPSKCPATPGAALSVSCKKPTEAERQQLAKWIACERQRPHNF